MDFYQYKQLEFRRKFWKFFGASITMFDPATNTAIGFIKMKAFKLREDVRLYRDPGLTQEVLHIHARQIVALNAVFDVTDSAGGQFLCSLRRKGLRSAFVRDHWDLLDAQGNAFGAIQETSSNLAIARRYVAVVPYIGEILALFFAFLPETYDILRAESGAAPQVACKLIHRKNPLVVKMGLDSSMAEVALDPHINIAAAAMLCIRDASKNA